MQPQYKVCRTCRIRKPIEDYPKSSISKGRTYLRTECRTCWNAFKRAHQQKYGRTDKGKRSAKNQNLKRYGLTIEEYEEFLAYQNHVCAICRKPNTIENRQLNVDHCHKTGKVRGLLCNNCNTLLGLALESIDTLQSAIKYLEESM